MAKKRLKKMKVGAFLSLVLDQIQLLDPNGNYCVNSCYVFPGTWDGPFPVIENITSKEKIFIIKSTTKRVLSSDIRISFESDGIGRTLKELFPYPWDEDRIRNFAFRMAHEALVFHGLRPDILSMISRFSRPEDSPV